MINYHSKLLSYADGDIYNHQDPAVYPKGQRCFEYHAHTHLEFIFVLEGEYRFKNGEKEEIYRAGEVFITNRDEPHSGFCPYTLPRNGYRYLQIDIDRLAGRLSRELSGLFSGETVYYNHIHAEDAKRSGLWESGNRLLEIVLQRSNRNEMEKLGCTLLFMHSLSAHRRQTGAAAVQRTDFVSKVAEYVDQNYAERITVEQIADTLGYEKSYFCRKMQREFGRTFSRYLHAARLNKFCSHPALNLQSIAQCAQDVGYSDYAYFYQIFRKAYKMSPREYLMKRARDLAETKH